MRMIKINPSDNYFLFTINTVTFLLLFIWIISIFILYIMVNENLACSLSLGYSAVTTVIWNIDTVLITSS